MDFSRCAWGVFWLAVAPLGCGGDDSSGNSTGTETDVATTSSGGTITADGTGTVATTDTPSTVTSDVTGSSSADVASGDATIQPTTDSSSSGGELAPGIYVHAVDGADSNDGSPEDPVRTIAQGMTLAMGSGLAAVYVAAGDYPQNSNDNQIVQVVDGISLFGGFSPDDWDDRDPTAFSTRVFDGADAPGVATPDAPHRPLEILTGVGPETAVDGFVLEASTQAFSAGAYLQGAGTIRNSRIVGGAGMSSPAVRLAATSTATLEFNTIDGGEASKGAPSFAITGADCAPTVVGNTIFSGTGTQNRAVALTNADGVFSGNVIVGELGGGGATRAVELTDSRTAIVGNTLVVEAEGLGYFVLLAGASELAAFDNNNFVPRSDTLWCYLGGGTDPVSVRGNNFNCSMLYSGTSAYTTIAALEGGLKAASDNVSEDPGVVDPAADWHINDDGSALCAVARGGVAFGATTPAFDIDAEPRTDPPSIGADEYDGRCL